MILRKIIKIVATRCQILRLKCTNFDFGWGSAPDPAGGAYSAPPDPVAGFKGAYFYGEGEERKGVEREGRGGKGKKGREKERREREWRVKTCCPMSNKLSPLMLARTLENDSTIYLMDAFGTVSS